MLKRLKRRGMLEILFCCIVILFIAIVFYKQANEEIDILQLDASRIEEVPSLYGDRSPIVLKGFPVPSLGSYEDMKKRPKVLGLTIGDTKETLDSLLHSDRLKDFTFHPTTMEFLAKESGLHVWFGLHCYNDLLGSKLTQWMYFYKTGLWPSHRGLWQTSAVHTLLVPTQGTAHVSLLLSKMIPYLPVEWKGRRLKSITAADTPLVSHLQYVEIKLKKGNALLLPPHILVDISSDGTNINDMLWMFQAEIHHPISNFAKS
jgi:hypothetical protein